MRYSRSALMSSVMLALLTVSATVVGVRSHEPGGEAFPTGTFVADFAHPDRYIEFRPDGTCRWMALDGGWERSCTYATSGEIFTETTFDWPGGPQVPATYFWHWDGAVLSFELWGEELRTTRFSSYGRYPLRLVEDGRVVYVATASASPGTLVSATRRLIPAADVPPGAVVDLSDVRGRVAAVAVERGQPITLDMFGAPAD